MIEKASYNFIPRQQAGMGMDIVPHDKFGERELAQKKQVFHILAGFGENSFADMVEDLPDIYPLSVSWQFVQTIYFYIVIFP